MLLLTVIREKEFYALPPEPLHPRHESIFSLQHLCSAWKKVLVDKGVAEEGGDSDVMRARASLYMKSEVHCISCMHFNMIT